LLTNIQAQIKLEDKFVNHKLEVLTNGTYQLKFLPTKAGAYHVMFLRDNKKIDGLYNFLISYMNFVLLKVILKQKQLTS
jgi:hypothetical protein